MKVSYRVKLGRYSHEVTAEANLPDVVLSLLKDAVNQLDLFHGPEEPPTEKHVLGMPRQVTEEDIRRRVVETQKMERLPEESLKDYQARIFTLAEQKVREARKQGTA